MNSVDVLLETNLPLRLFSRGKVRDIYDLDDKLLIITTDRISAFDCVLPNGIPNKGKILNLISNYWFDFTEDIIKNHMISTDIKKFPEELQRYSKILEGRSMLVKKAKRIDIECVVRGYLAGSGWREYKKNGSICGIKLPNGLVESEKLPEPIFTPAIKAFSGHDENISEKRVSELIGNELTCRLKEKSLQIYKKAYKHAEKRGIIIADTKFEFGLIDEKLILIDELLTPDSSRFWSVDDYKKGGSQESFDKQFVRDYLENIGWDKKPPAPELPIDVVRKTSEKYLELYKRITGKNICSIQ